MHLSRRSPEPARARRTRSRSPQRSRRALPRPRRRTTQRDRLGCVHRGVILDREISHGAAVRHGRGAAADKPTIFFLDEIHRFNKAQQDALLPAVEEGLFSNDAATTENPYFEVIS